MFAFGSGIMWARPLMDASGNAITTPTPQIFGTLQEGGVDFSFDLKQQHGQNQFAEDIARGKAEISGKAKIGRLHLDILNSVIFGQTVTDGLLSAKYETALATIPGTPFAITVTPPNSGTFGEDLGVIGSDGRHYTRVASSPSTGEYSLSGAVYTFAAADEDAQVFINYSYTASGVAGARKMTAVNLPMGSVPSFQLDLFMAKDGKTLKLKLFKCVSSKLGMATRQDDYMNPDIDFMAFANAAGQVFEMSIIE